MLSRRSFARALAPVLLLLMVVTAACAKNVDGPTAAPADPTTSTTQAPAGPTYPLTGLPSDDEARRTRPALVVKIDNNEGARPPVGINQADVVYEEEIEAGFTRFAAIFHSQDADPVGPIRSARISDIELLANLNRPMLAWSGANAVTASAIRSADLVDVGFDAVTDEYDRATNRPAPSNLFATTTGLYTHAGDARFAPPLFEYEDGAGVPSSSSTTTSTTTAPGAGGATTAAPTGAPAPVAGGRVAFRSRDIAYVWDEGRSGWARFQDGTPYADDTNEPVVPTNVVFLYIDYVCCPTVPGTPEAQTVGEGDAAVFTDGHFVDARWSRPSGADVWNLTDKATGQPVLLTPGRTWVELANPGSGSFVDQAEADQLLAALAQPITQELGTPEF
ncbi:MAG: DUF3048 domain-containing protein [Acidimicrobiales bacterium]|nr:DUF3048 domain-containing protein [Acidimicrobiales bacterium]